MAFTSFDLIAFILFIAFVIGVSLWASRGQSTSEEYFLAGRNLSWWLIGFSLIAPNISTEHFVGMAGNSTSCLHECTYVFTRIIRMPHSPRETDR